MLRFLPIPGQTPTHHVCAVFADVVGSTHLAQHLSAPQYAALMTEAVQLIILSLEAGAGAVLQHQGDAVVALWPQAAAKEALQASLTVHTHLGNLELSRLLHSPLQLRVGLSAGEVVMGQLCGAPNAYGLPLNLARRLCSAAHPGSTLVCPNAKNLLTQPGANAALHRFPLALPDFKHLPAAYLALPLPSAQMKSS